MRPPSGDSPPSGVSANGVHRACVSPALLGSAAHGCAYELKFVLDQARAGVVERWAQAHLALDPHADATLGNAYRVHSLYLDTADLDVYHRTPSFGRRKFRLRRYGTEPRLFLERKTRSGERVAKKRTPITDGEIDRLTAAGLDPAWAGHWYQRRLQVRRLQPTAQITYDRVAFIGAAAEGPMRLTLDHGIHCAPASTWQVAEPQPSLPLLPVEVILELKYRTALPLLFKRLVQEFDLQLRPASKYRLSVEAWGLAKTAKEVG